MNATQPTANHAFVSHNYKDDQALAACVRRRFPGGLAPFVYPPRTVTPDEAVSDNLIDAIRACGGFVYLDTALSGGSFWVGFERNIAARLGKHVYAFRPKRPFFAFRRDMTAPADPIVSILFNQCVREDGEKIQTVRQVIWDRFKFEIRGDQWRRLDNDQRQMLDSIPGLQRKFASGGVALLFLSNESICAGHHDYADAYTLQRANKDMETPIGHAAEKFASLEAGRTLVIWLDEPDRARIEAALDRFNPQVWAPYLRLVRAALDEVKKLVVFRAGDRLDMNCLDTMLARCFWTAVNGDPRLAAEFRRDVLRLDEAKPPPRYPTVRRPIDPTTM